MELLTGTGLATAAGLNAYIPLLVMGLLGRYTGLIELPKTWAWLENGWVIAILVVLLAIEFVADKIPAVDSANDVLQTFVRPTSGGMVFAAGTGSQTFTVKDPGDLFTQKMWIPIVVGLLISLSVHIGKATVRPVANVATVGLAAPVVSTAEDATSTGLSLVAIIVPILVIIFVIMLVWLFFRWRRKRRWRGQPALVERAH